MGAWSIEHPELFKVSDESCSISYFGCSQEWYTDKWQRLSGCGPTAASNIMMYVKNGKSSAGLHEFCRSREECLSFMEEMWEYVTPTLRGVHTTKRFYEGLSAYAASKKIKAGFQVLDLPRDRSKRPSLARVLGFIEEGLAEDCPVAFLNLCNGKEHRLDRWHWVTIISLEHTGEADYAVAEVLDEGAVKKLNLALWYNTTKLGGGFVYLVRQDS
ncbi:MAG: hypothetical protein H6Q58_1842 [Firmicutes bacterium]|nr:hypothetical protein [Bacillota bacterium]